MSFNFAEQENKILKFWEKNRIFEKLQKKNKGAPPAGGKRWSFLDGPITANNPMGVHHAWGRTYKDVFQRYKAMRGFDQRFQNGFDCQGLWVEVEVEKELGFKNKKDIEKYGIAKFVEKCKERVRKFSKIQTEQSIRLGQWMDWENSYYTMSDENNYAIWSFLKKCKEKGLLYKGRDVVPWCPRCGTSISQHEILTEEYKEIVHKAVFVKFKVIAGLPASTGVSVDNRENVYFLVWTTTPWTLPGNVALAVHPDYDYVVVSEKRKAKSEKPQLKTKNLKKEERLILLKDKINILEDGYEVLMAVKGKELKGLEYEGLFDELPAAKKALSKHEHRVILWKDVTTEEGTGVVHTAPGCGREDFQLSKELKLPVIDLTDDESKYKKGLGDLTGKFAGSQEVRDWIFKDLESKAKVFKIENYKHRYPTCWRCKQELIFRLVDEWYIAMDKLRKPLTQSAKKINWIPSFGLDRELDWLKNMRDWLISKKRYWGLALPIFECQCGNFEVIGSKQELEEKAVSGWQEFDPPTGGKSPHRPWVDNVKIKCSKCGAEISRIKDVGTPWLDAGIVPFSTIKYFEDKEYWKKWFPIDFITESFPGQFKNWFYVLLVMSQVLENRPPFETVLGFASVVDEKGEEMHKSKGNAIWFDDAVEKIGADVMRWMYVRQNPVYNLRFGHNAANETARKLLTLWNSYKFFETYGSKASETEPRDPTSNRSGLGVGLLDKWILSRLNGLIQAVTKNLDKFDAMRASKAIEHFFIEDLSLWYIRRSRKRFAQAAPTLYCVLLNLAKLIAPIMPFLAEEFYQKLRSTNMPESVHLCDWPQTDKKFIDKELEKQMSQVRDIVALTLAKRTELGIRVRQPLQKLKVKSKKVNLQGKSKNFLEELISLVKEEVNVKKVVFDDKIKQEVQLDTKITKELKEEGQVREIIRHIQDLRKKAGLTPKDKVAVYYSTDSALKKIIEKKENKKLILEATRSKELKENTNKQGTFLRTKDVKINSQCLWLGLKS